MEEDLYTLDYCSNLPPIGGCLRRLESVLQGYVQSLTLVQLSTDKDLAIGLVEHGLRHRRLRIEEFHLEHLLEPFLVCLLVQGFFLPEIYSLLLQLLVFLAEPTGMSLGREGYQFCPGSYGILAEAHVV